MKQFVFLFWMFISLWVGYVVGAIVYEPDKYVVNEIVNTVKEKPNTIYSLSGAGKNLGIYYWHLGYRQGADAVIESIKTGNTGNFSKQMELDSLSLELTINEIIPKT